MGVHAYPYLVKKTKGSLEIIEDKTTPENDPLYSLIDLMYKEEWRNSLISLCPSPIDFSFFLKTNNHYYDDDTHINTSFTPDEVLNCIKGIEYVFREKEDQFIRPYQYVGVYDNSDVRIEDVFVESIAPHPVSDLSPKKIHYGHISAYDNYCRIVLQERMLKLKSNHTPGEIYILSRGKSSSCKSSGYGSWEIDLTQEEPVLYYAIQGQNDQKKKGEIINWHIKKSRFYDQLKPELENLTTLAVYAKNHGLELQIILC